MTKGEMTNYWLDAVEDMAYVNFKDYSLGKFVTLDGVFDREDLQKLLDIMNNLDKMENRND